MHERVRALGERERDLHRWILDRFAHGEPPSGAAVRFQAADLGLEADAALATLSKGDLVHTDEHGEIVVAYPFAGYARGHRVLIDNKYAVEAMCAIDALGIAPMLDLPVEISSRDPVSGGEIWVRLDPGDGAWWEPETVVVLGGSCCCNLLNFFESDETEGRFRREHGDLHGEPVPMPKAIDAGRTVFGTILKEP